MAEVVLDRRVSQEQLLGDMEPPWRASEAGLTSGRYRLMRRAKAVSVSLLSPPRAWLAAHSAGPAGIDLWSQLPCSPAEVRPVLPRQCSAPVFSDMTEANHVRASRPGLRLRPLALYRRDSHRRPPAPARLLYVYRGQQGKPLPLDSAAKSIFDLPIASSVAADSSQRHTSDSLRPLGPPSSRSGPLLTPPARS